MKVSSSRSWGSWGSWGSWLARVAVATAAASVVGCASDGADDESFAGDPQAIIDGQAATVYAEAALVNTDTFICSGAVIAPRVVLTAGHCVSGATTWSVTTPFAGGQRATSARPWTKYENLGEYVNPDTIDVGLLILDSPIDLPFYPPLSTAAVPEGTLATNVGRIKDGRASNTSLFFGRDVPLYEGADFGFPLAYVSREIIQSGDSGGPVYVKTPQGGRMIVAVNSGAGGGTQTLARVDLLKNDIDRLIADNGGTGTSPRPNEPATCAGPREVEPNDQPVDADALVTARCGALTSSDIDWFGWQVGGAGIAYEVEVEASDDAELFMWKETSLGWQLLRNASATRYAARSGGAGRYLVAVRSASGTPQSYRITLAK